MRSFSCGDQGPRKVLVEPMRDGSALGNTTYGSASFRYNFACNTRTSKRPPTERHRRTDAVVSYIWSTEASKILGQKLAAPLVPETPLAAAEDPVLRHGHKVAPRDQDTLFILFNFSSRS